MSDKCNVCLTELDDNQDCPICDYDKAIMWRDLQSLQADLDQLTQELDGERSRLDYPHKEISNLEAQAHKYKQALKFYADPKTYYYFDLSAVAQAALQGESKEDIKPCRYKRSTRGIDSCMLGDSLEGCTKPLKEQQTCDRRIRAEDSPDKDMVLVPREPTEEMTDAGEQAHIDCWYVDTKDRDFVKPIYEAMINVQGDTNEKD